MYNLECGRVKPHACEVDCERSEAIYRLKGCPPQKNQYLETQVRAHAELDAVVGRTRLPTFADYPHLPYIRAMVKEILRWKPVGPLAVPHRLAEDDWYNGMFIPKGTICIPDVMAHES